VLCSPCSYFAAFISGAALSDAVTSLPTPAPMSTALQIVSLALVAYLGSAPPQLLSRRRPPGCFTRLDRNVELWLGATLLVWVAHTGPWVRRALQSSALQTVGRLSMAMYVCWRWW